MAPKVARSTVASSATSADPKITVACYYFGNFHPGDARNESMKGAGWTEWELLKKAKPRFANHQQPKVPLWGYQDESDPIVMEQKITAAADHCIDAFIFDWYYYEDGPFLERPLDRGFLGARNNDRIQFALMWANHDWLEIQPCRKDHPAELVFPGAVSAKGFEKVCDVVIEKYFAHPSYWKIEERPYFSIYDLTKFLEGFNSLEEARGALDNFRTKARRAGHAGVHLNAVVWGEQVMPWQKVPADPARLVDDLGFDSVTSYVWFHHVGLPEQSTDYDYVREQYFKHWAEMDQMFSQPYYPNVTMGWDSSPRAHQDDELGDFGYPFTNTIGGNTPERFRLALELTKKRLLANGPRDLILNINSWNEWTEGSYLEPDMIHGMKYLEAVRDVFGTQRAATQTPLLVG